MSTKYNCAKCGCGIAIDNEDLNIINDEIFCPKCKNWSKCIATTTPDYAQVVDVVVLDDVEIDNHSDHYQVMPIEPFRVMEQRMKIDPTIPAGDMPGSEVLLCLALALKHIMRAGLKPGQSWRKDIEKAMNYLNKALTGKWLGDSDE